MHSLVADLMGKKGIDNVAELSEEEQVTLNNWNRILSDGEMSVDKIVDFCRAQLKLIEAQWKNLDNSAEKNTRLVLQHMIYSTLIDVITGPRAERESLEKHLRSLLDQ